MRSAENWLMQVNSDKGYMRFRIICTGADAFTISDDLCR